MSGIEIVGLIASVAGILTAAQAASRGIKDISGLPQAFTEVSQRIPLALQLLREIENRTANAPEVTVKALIPVVESCKRSAESLESTFQKVLPDNKMTSWNMERYVKIIKGVGEKGRVESLMKKVLEDLQLLATDQTLNAATASQVESLREAVDALAKVEPSAPSEAFEDRARINISHGGTGAQVTQVGERGQSHSGSGHIFGDLRGANLSFNQTPESCICTQALRVSRCKINADAIRKTAIDNKEEKVAKLLGQLYACPYRDRKDMNPAAITGTCEWLLNHPLFLSWQEAESSILWVSADPGCGKSVLSKHVVDIVLPSTSSGITAYFFFKDDFEDQRSSTIALCCILRQILSQKHDLITEEMLQRVERTGSQLMDSFEELWEIFLDITGSQNAGQITCVIDALDECADDGRQDLIRALSSLSLEPAKSANLRIFLTSRPYRNIKRDFNEFPIIHLQGEDEVEVDKISKEIDLVISARVSNLRKRLDFSADEEDFLLKELSLARNRTYLWVELVCKFIRNIDMSHNNIREIVNTLPRTVEESYERILQQGSNPSLARDILHIVVAAERPFSLDEMALAVAITTASSPSGIRPESPSRFGERMRDACGLFVTVVGDKIYLIHQTASEFLRMTHREPKRDSSWQWRQSLWPGDSNSILANLCLKRLSLLENKHVSKCYERKRSRKAHDETCGPLLFGYSAAHWTVHLQKAEFDDWTETDQMVMKACTSSMRRIWLDHHKDLNRNVAGRLQRYPSSKCSAMTLACAFGIERLIIFLLRRDGKQNDETVPDDGYKWFALSWAAANGHAGVIKLLVNEGAPSSKLGFYKSSEVGVGKKDSGGRTPLMIAVLKNREAAVEALLASGKFDVNSRGSTFTAQTFKEIGKVQANRRQKPEANGQGDTQDMSPLEYAIYTKHETIARLLLSADSISINPDVLTFAAEEGMTDTVKLLLDTGKVNPNSKDCNGFTALGLAAAFDCQSVVRLLVGHKDIDVNLADRDGFTPYLDAVCQGNLQIVRILTELGGANVNSADKKGRTPLIQAVRYNRKEILEYLVRVPGIDIEQTDNRDETALLHAAGQRHRYEVFEILVVSGNANVNAVDWKGRTPLSLAYRKDGWEYVQCLLDSGRVSAESHANCDVSLTAKDTDLQSEFQGPRSYSRDHTRRRPQNLRSLAKIVGDYVEETMDYWFG